MSLTDKVMDEALRRWPNDWFDRAAGERNTRSRHAFEDGAAFVQPLLTKRLHDTIVRSIRESWDGEEYLAWGDSEYARGQLELALTITQPNAHEDGDDMDVQRDKLWSEVWER